ncbi:integrin alpha [Nodosilinea sp. FACHB-13]|uniref:integrin alpha n=1 Tax=Cyanophyceae TaxID=3028117 RepID=UPI0016897538|nr:integrin alpha [Nodosilinea sp. FACHB-13]MBD2108181.1 FG-GAP repeat protein [Nodosilinea sp. FACHB-13]
MFDLSTLNGSNGFVINGIDAGDLSGFSVSNAGDINNDGVDDLIIGASGADPNGKSDAGKSYVVFGGAGVGSSGSFNLPDLH